MIRFYVRRDRPHVYLEMRDRTGKRRRQKTPFKTADLRVRDGKYLFSREMLNWQRRFELAQTSGLGVPQAVQHCPSLRSVLDQYIEFRIDLAEKTKKAYRFAVKKFGTVFGDPDCKFPIDLLTEDVMISLRNKLIHEDGKSNARNYLTHIGVILHFAADKRYIPYCPITRFVKFRVPDHEIICPSHRELLAILDYADDRAYKGLSDQLRFLVFSGCRARESCDITWDRIDWDRSVIQYWNQKGKRWVDQPIDEEFLIFLKKVPHKYGKFLFRYRCESSLTHAFKRAVRHVKVDGNALNEDYHLHNLKVYAVGRWRSMGLSMIEISGLAKHANIQTTAKYYAYFDGNGVASQMNNALVSSGVIPQTSSFRSRVLPLLRGGSNNRPGDEKQNKVG